MIFKLVICFSFVKKYGLLGMVAMRGAGYGVRVARCGLRGIAVRLKNFVTDHRVFELCNN